MRRKLRPLFLICMVLAAVPAAAQLERAGAVDPATGYPMWYQDRTGLVLEFCQPLNNVELTDGWCLLLPGDTSVPETFPSPFSEEHFYWAASATADGVANGAPVRALLTLALEGAFAQGPVIAGDQIVFGRIRVSIKSVPFSGTYVVYHPYGTEMFTLTAGERLFFTEDIGFGCAGQFDCALQSRVGPFLLPADTPGGPELPAITGPVAGKLYIADPARLGPVTGSPVSQNFFRVEGPNGFLATTENFALMGRVFTGAIPGKLTIDRATYASTPSPDPGGAPSHQVDVFATALPTSQARMPASAKPPAVTPVLAFYPAACAVTATGALTEPPGVASVQMFNDGSHYWGQGQPSAVPGAVCVEDYTARDINGQVVPLFIQAAVTDLITIASATYDPAKGGILSVSAASSDHVTAPSLSVAAFGAMTKGSYVRTPISAAPPKVRVVSSRGGQAELSVTAALGTPGGGGVPIPGNDEVTLPEDSPTVLMPVLANDTVNGAPIAPSDSPVVTIVVAPRLGVATVQADGQIAYTPNPNTFGSEGIGYTVAVNGISSPVAYVTIIITPVNDAPVANDDAANGVANQAIAIDALANDTDVDGQADLSTVVIATPPSGATVVVGTGGVLSFTATAAGTYAFTYFAKDAAGELSALPATVTVTVAGIETLSVTRADFVRISLRWRVDGTDSIHANQTITITYEDGKLLDGTLLQGTVIGTAVVDATGAWILDLRLTSPTDLRNPNATNLFARRPSQIRATSSLGATVVVPFVFK